MFEINKYYDVLFPLLFAIIVGLLSYLLFYLFKNNGDKTEQFTLGNNPTMVKKKNKKKSVSKGDKQSSLDTVAEVHVKSIKHIEIKNSPEILENIDIKELHIFENTQPIKPILKNIDDVILVNETTVNESHWEKMPRDELEIIRSRHSSIASDPKIVINSDENKEKLSKNQKKRLKAKAKAAETKKNEIDAQINQFNNSAECFSTYDKEECLESDSLELQEDKNGSKIELKLSELEHIQKEEFEDFDFAIDIDNNTLEVPDQNESRIEELEEEIKELKNFNKTLELKLNEIMSMNKRYQNENEHLMKKTQDCDQTINALKLELSNSIQKANNLENRLMRLNTEYNQRCSYQDSQSQNLKTNLENIQHLLSEKDKTIKNLEEEKSIYKDKCNMQTIECHDLKSKFKNYETIALEMDKKLKKNIEEYNQLAIENQELKKMKQKLKQYYDEIDNAKKQEVLQNTIIKTLQYQIDDYQMELKNMTLDIDRDDRTKCSEIEIENLKAKLIEAKSFNRESNNENFQAYINVVNNAKKALNDKSLEYKQIMNYKNDEIESLIEYNHNLKGHYKDLTLEIQTHLKEIVKLKKCFEDLQKNLLVANNSNDIRINDDNSAANIVSGICDTECIAEAEQILLNLEKTIAENELRRGKIISSVTNNSNSNFQK